MRLLLSHFTIFAILILPFASVAEANPEAQVRTLLAALAGQSPREVKEESDAAKKLGEYPYAEVANALIAKMGQEVQSTKPNTFILQAINDSLAKMPAQNLAEAVRKAGEAFTNKHTNNPEIARVTLGVVQREIKKVVEKCESAVAALPKLTTSGVIVLEAPGIRALAPTPAAVAIPVAQAGPAQTLSEMIKANANADALNKLYEKVRPGIERILSDDLVELQRASRLIAFQGREVEIEKVEQALSREVKGHVLLTGKAGVGKTTLLRMMFAKWLNHPEFMPGENLPIVIEMSITTISNPSDPSQIKSLVLAAKDLARQLGRRVILFFDEAHIATGMTKNALKGFLTETLGDESNVHMIWATTSQESRSFLSDSAFSRRWVEVHVPEFNKEETKRAVQNTFLPLWQLRHSSPTLQLTGITDEALELAYKYAYMEQPHTGNPAGIRELLEGAIINKKFQMLKQKHGGDGQPTSYELQPADIRGYLKFQKGIKLFPGDASFEQELEALWAQLRERYVGNDGFIESQKKALKRHFGNLKPEKLFATILAGPPGAGKSYFTELVAEIFYSTKPLILNGGEYGTGGFDLNKLIGSVAGTVGSEEQRSVLTKYIRDNPQGGVIVFREANLVHQNVLNWLADAITSRTMTDGLGQSYSLDKYLFYFETNIGQDMLVASTGRESMTWEELETRRQSMIREKIVDGQRVEELRPEVQDRIFKGFTEDVATRSNPHGDTAKARENSLKLRRRFGIDYVFLPTRSELQQAVLVKFKAFKESAKVEYNVEFDISESDLLQLIDVDKANFEMGHGWVEEQLQSRLLSYLTGYTQYSGQHIKISVTEEEQQVGAKTVRGLGLNVQHSNQTDFISLGIAAPSSPNPWFSNEKIRTRIQKFRTEIDKYVKGQDAQKSYLASALKAKALNWSKRIVITQIGTSGNGKTEFGYGTGEALFESRDSVFRMTKLQRWGDLNNYFRSDTGFVGSWEETDFERWFKARKSAGGGVIILDELLSFHGLTGIEIGEKLNLINNLYPLLESGVLPIGNREEDASSFIFVVTGNALQELFDGIDDSPEAERLVQKILERTTDTDIEKSLQKWGLDAPKVARLGKIFLNGPLPKNVVDEVGRKEIEKIIQSATNDIRDYYDVEVVIDPDITTEIINRVTTVRLGMRKVKAAIDIVVGMPIGEIVFDRMGAGYIEAKLVNDEIQWFVREDKKAKAQRVVKSKVSGTESSETWILQEEVLSSAMDITPQLRDIETQPKIVMTEQALRETAIHELYGHWMVSYLLRGKNNMETISLKPGEGYLGYVRPLMDLHQYDGSSLVSLMIDVANLEAGHRAVFLSGVFDTGGGSSGADSADSTRSDDMAKVDARLDAMLSNALLEDFSEFDSPQTKSLFKRFLRLVGKRMADSVIHHGLQTQQFEKFFETLLRERFMSQQDIETLVADIDTSKLMSPAQLMITSLDKSIRHALVYLKKAGDLRPRELSTLARLAQDLLGKVSTQLLSRPPLVLSPEEMDKIKLIAQEGDSFIRKFQEGKQDAAEEADDQWRLDCQAFLSPKPNKASLVGKRK